MKHIGLTGNIGSGKTTVSRIFQALGVPIYSADEHAKQFLETKYTIEQIKNVLGAGCIDDTGSPNKKKIAALVFNNPHKLKQLEQIIHPQVRNDFFRWAAQHKSRDYVIMEAAILFETGQAQNFDQLILVTAPEQLRIERVCKRDSVDRQHVIQRMKNQWSQEIKIGLSDYVIVNDDKQVLIPQVEAVHKAIIDHHGRKYR